MDKLVGKVKQLNPKLSAHVVFNRAPTNPASVEIEEICQVMAEFDHLLLTTNVIIKERVAYRKAAKEGLAVFEIAKVDHKASTEMLALYEDAYDIVERPNIINRVRSK